MQIREEEKQMEYIQDIKSYVNLEINVLKKLDILTISNIITVLTKALEEERDIYIFGNGGSAATASHFKNDFNKCVWKYTEKKFRFHCLNDNIPILTAIANDIGYEEIYSWQLRGCVRKEDIIIAISGSGNSENVLRAVQYAKERGVFVIAFTGYDGGKLGKMADMHLNININSMQITEDIHMIIDHLMISILYKTLLGKDHLENE